MGRTYRCEMVVTAANRANRNPVAAGNEPSPPHWQHWGIARTCPVKLFAALSGIRKCDFLFSSALLRVAP
jgi:hypothetical protein